MPETRLEHQIKELKQRWQREGGGTFTLDKLIIKLMEEAGELAASHVRHRADAAKDAIGDCGILLSFIAEQYDTTLQECMQEAYWIVKDRKGKMVDGVFVKNGDV